MFSLEGKTALVTGANTGLGQGLAVGLAEAGADIVAAGRSVPTETEAAVKALGRKFAFVPADFSKPSVAGEVAAQAEVALGPVDIAHQGPRPSPPLDRVAARRQGRKQGVPVIGRTVGEAQPHPALMDPLAPPA